MKTSFFDTFPKRSVRKGLDEEIWPPRGFFAVLLTLADLHPDKNIPLSLVTRLWGQNNWN